MKIKKDWYNINEIAKLWSCSKEDILHLGMCNKLELCFDWKKLESKQRIAHGRYITPHFVFVDLATFVGSTIKHPDVISELNFESYNPGSFLTPSDDDEELLFEILKPSNSSKNSILARFCALEQSLLFNITNGLITLPSSTDHVFPKIIGHLSGHQGYIVETHLNKSNETIEYLLCPDDLVITAKEKERYEGSNEELTVKHLFEKDSIPTNLYLAYQLFNEIWDILPKDMNRPSKLQLQQYLEQKGVKEKNSIDAIIKSSTPDRITLGGKRKQELKPFDISTLNPI
jgi:hypothetical protein